jgi:hypothetical protein
MSRSDRDHGRRNRAFPESADQGTLSSTTLEGATVTALAADTDIAAASGLHDQFGNTAMLGALGGEWDGGIGPMIADGLTAGTEGFAPTGEIGVSPSNSVMLRAMRDAFEAQNYDAGASVLNGLRPSGGEKLPEDVRARFESAMGHDLGHVRIHRDGVASSQSEALNAYAFTIGSHIWFRSGGYDPETVRGKQLLAHELTHVQQHDEGRINPHVSSEGMSVSSPSDPLEVEAYAAESRIANSLPTTADVTVDEGEGLGIQRPSMGLDAPAAAAPESAVEQGPVADAAVMRDEQNPNKLEKVGDGHHKLSDAVVKDFKAAAADVKKATGQSIDTEMGDTTRPLASTTNKSGASNWSWHKTGRAFDINQNLKWIIVKDPKGKQTFFRLYLAAKGDGGGQPTVQFKRNGTPELYLNQEGNNAYKKKFVDVTAILEGHGWSRIPAQKGFSKRGQGYNKQEWWHYEQRDENSWYEALDEVYDKDEIRDGLRPLRNLRGANNRMTREGVPQDQRDLINANRNASGPMARATNVAAPGNSKGQPLPAVVAEQLRSVLGDAVDQVRVHVGREAASFSESLNANAVTVGTDVFFNAGRFDASSEQGLRILAEEVHHAVVGGGSKGVSQPGDSHELKAKAFASEFAQGLMGTGAEGGLGNLTDLVGNLGNSAKDMITEGTASVTQAFSGVQEQASGMMDSAEGALSGMPGQMSGAMDSLSGGITGAAETAGLTALELDIPEQLKGALAQTGDGMSDINALTEAAGISQVDTMDLSGEGLASGAQDMLGQLSPGGVTDMASLTPQMSGSMTEIGGMAVGLSGILGKRRRKKAEGSPGFSLNAAGPAPAQEEGATPGAANAANGERDAEAREGSAVEAPSSANAGNMRLDAPAAGGAGGGSAGGGSAGAGVSAPQAVTPKEPVTSSGTKEHAQSVADAAPSLKAASYASTATELNTHATTEGGELQESIPEFHAVLTENGAPTAMTAPAESAVEAPAVEEVADSATGLVEQPEIAPTEDLGEFTANASAANQVAAVSEDAPQGDKQSAVSAALRSIQTEDGAVQVSPGPAPFLQESGDADPLRADRDRDANMLQAQTASSTARTAIIASPGSELVIPNVMDESYTVDSLKMPSFEGASGTNPEVQKFLASTVSGDVVASFDEFESPTMEASHQAFEDSVKGAVETRDTDSETSIEETTIQADRLVSEANAEQQATVAEQRGLIEAERQRTMAAGDTALGQFRAEAQREHGRVSGDVRREINTANDQVAQEYRRAETEAASKVTEGETEANAKREAMEREQEDQSWWQKAASWVSEQLDNLASAITNMFNAIRDAVTSILDAVKELATQIIDAAVSFVCTALEAFGEFLKAGINLLVGSIFPDLAAALNGFVDAGVTYATTAVTALGENLKAGINSLVNAITATLNAIIDVFNAAVHTAMSILQAVISGDWVQILLALLEAALRLCGISPDEFYGLVGTAEDTIDIIVNNPGQFIGNLIEAVGQGFGQFADNFLSHLQSGFMDWLTGQAGVVGIELMESFDLKGLIGMGLQLLGLTYDAIRAKAVDTFGEEVVENAEFVIDFLDTMIEEGVVDGLWEYMEGSVDGIWESVMGGIQEWLAETIIRKAVVKIASMFNPVGAIVQALLTAWDLYSWVKDNVQQIYAVVTSVVSNIHAIATGAIGGAADMIEGSLGDLVPVAIDLLAKVLGLGNIGEKVTELLQDVRDPINEGLDTAFEWLKGHIDSVGDFIMGRDGEEESTTSDSDTAVGEAAAADADDISPDEDPTTPTLTGTWGTPTAIVYRHTSEDGDQITPIRAHGSFSLEVTEQSTFETQWKSGESWDNRGLASFIRTQVVSKFTPVIANASASVPAVAAPGAYAGYSSATQAGVNNDLTGYGIRLKSVNITSINLGDESSSDLEQGEGSTTDDKAFLEARQGFSADGHQHHTWVDTAGGGFTPMVASTPISGLALVADWRTRLNTNAFDNDSRQSAAATLNSAEGAMTSLANLQGNLAGFKDSSDPSAKQRVLGLIRTRQQSAMTHLTQGFVLFGDDTVRDFDWLLAQPANGVARHKWDQVNADAARVPRLAGTLPLFKTAVEEYLKRENTFDEETLSVDSLHTAMKSVVAANHGRYLLQGEIISTEAIAGAAGLGRAINIYAVFKYNYVGRDEYKDEMKQAPNSLARENPEKAWAFQSKRDDTFEPDDHMMGETKGQVPAGWWFAGADGTGVKINELREALTLNDPSFDAGCVKLTYSASDFDSAGYELFKPTAFDGMHQGWEDDTMWASTGDSVTWGLTKSINQVREGVTKPVSVTAATSRVLAWGDTDANYDPVAMNGVQAGEEETQMPTEADYLQWFAFKACSGTAQSEINSDYIASPGAGGLAASKDKFRQWLTATGWTFASELTTQWSRYMGHNEHAGYANIAGPSILPISDNPDVAPDDAASVEYATQDGVGYVQGSKDEPVITDEDVNQGGLGDCYLIAGMAAVAKADPKAIADAVQDHGDGTYTVTLFDKDGKKVVQRLDSQVPMSGGNVKYAQSENTNEDGQAEMWPQMIEKAYANMGGGYGPIEGGFPGEAVQAITGVKNERVYAGSEDEDVLLSRLNSEIEDNSALTAWTRGGDSTKDDVKKLMDEYDVYANHAYSFRSVDAKTKMVSMRNPWGSSHPKPMSIDIFKKIYPWVDVNDLKKDS